MVALTGMVVVGMAVQPFATSRGALVAHEQAAASQPLAVVSSSLRQDGQQLVWQVRLAQPFSARGLAEQDRGLCVAIEQADGGQVAAEACVASGSDDRTRLVYEQPSKGAGPPRVIQATMTRSSSSELTASFLPSALGLGYRSLWWQVVSSVSAPACVTTTSTTTTPSGSASCSTSWPVRPRLLRLHTPRLVRCVASGQSEVFQGSAARHELALTFDDGPWNDPPSIDFVKLLAREHVPATFFEIGSQIPEYDASGSVERAMLADGDMIADHTWSHPDMLSLSPAEQREELQWTIDAISERTGFTPCLWRPPYGDVDTQLVSLARSMGLLTIMWDVDPDDWTLPGTAAIYKRVVSAAHNGAIVIQHFGGGPRMETLAALPQEIATLRHEGYKFVTIAQLLNLMLIYH
jgi:peptidoglycan/xylan/chitin deacetylase (PgdA/CDA1 family)